MKSYLAVPAMIGMYAFASVGFADTTEREGPVALTDAEMDQVTAAGNHENRPDTERQEGLINVRIGDIGVNVAAVVLSRDTVIEQVAVND
jgi:hypothetical protein